MIRMKRYTWLINTIRRAGEISHNDLSRLWESNEVLSSNKPLNRSTFSRWRKDIQEHCGISIGCKKTGNRLYHIMNPDDFDNCTCLGELSIECLSRIKKEDIITECEIRQDLLDCMFYLGKKLKLDKDSNTEFHDNLVRWDLSYRIDRHMTKAEISYTVNQLLEWFSHDYKLVKKCVADLALSDLSKSDILDRRLGLSDKTLVTMISDHGEMAYLSLKRHFDKVAVRKLFFRKANERDPNYAYHLADYLYQKRRYAKTFDYLNKVNRKTYETLVAKRLGLMYFYGRGVVRDYDKAKNYLESHMDAAGAEEMYALGEIYMRHTGNFGKAAEMYQTFLIQPYQKRKDPFYRKILNRFTEIRSTFGIPDWIIMTVVIGKNNRRCEFSVELPAFCRILLCWGEPRSMIYIYNSGEERRYMTFRHTYRRPGEYKINFEVTCIHAIEALEFSRYRKQLKDIKFLTGRGLKKLSIIGQCLKTLSLPPGENLAGLICRDNAIDSLDLNRCPRLTYLDCASNPISVLKLHRNSSLTKACIRNTQLDRGILSKILRSNRGSFCNALTHNLMQSLDMRLEYYFRCTTWDKTRKYLRTKLNHYYCHALAECESAFFKLKEMARKNNRTPYKNGYVEVDDDYVSEDLIAGHEEFFLEKEPWSVSLATKVRDMYNKEPWMRSDPTLPEYYVASCLVNMIRNVKEMKSLKKY